MEPTLNLPQKSASHKTFHAFCHCIAALIFLLASIITSPLIFKPFDATELCSKIYLAGCLFFILAHGTELLYLITATNKSLPSALNQLFATIGYAIFMAGSSHQPPQNEVLNRGEKLYAAGSSLVVLAYSLALFSILNKNDADWWNNIKQNAGDFLINFFAWGAALMFLIGSCLYLRSVLDMRSLIMITSTLFVVGSVSFLFSSAFLCKKYFYDQMRTSNYIDNGQQISNSQIRDII